MARCTVGSRLGAWICLRPSAPTPFNALFRQRAGVSLLRLSVAASAGSGILTASSIACPSRVRLRSRLTLIRLALIRKPWSYGEGVFRPLYRYLYLHLLFHTLQSASRLAFNTVWNAPLPTTRKVWFHVFGTGLMPDYYPCAAARPVSCYALFK